MCICGDNILIIDVNVCMYSQTDCLVSHITAVKRLYDGRMLSVVQSFCHDILQPFICEQDSNDDCLVLKGHEIVHVTQLYDTRLCVCASGIVSCDGLSVDVIIKDVMVRDIVQLRDGRLALIDSRNLYVCTSSGHVLIKRRLNNAKTLHQLADGRLLIHMGDGYSSPAVYYVVVEMLLPPLYSERINSLSDVSILNI